MKVLAFLACVSLVNAQAEIGGSGTVQECGCLKEIGELKRENEFLLNTVSQLMFRLKNVEDKVIDIETKPKVTRESCPSGWAWSNDTMSCYHFVPHNINWFEANTYCRSRKASMVMIDSQAEQDFLVQYIRADSRRDNYDYWIGASSLDDGSTFIWNNGEKLEYTSWNKKQPDNSGGDENCVELKKSFGYWMWNDLQCHDRAAVICEL